MSIEEDAPPKYETVFQTTMYITDSETIVQDNHTEKNICRVCILWSMSIIIVASPFIIAGFVVLLTFR